MLAFAQPTPVATCARPSRFQSSKCAAPRTLAIACVFDAKLGCSVKVRGRPVDFRLQMDNLRNPARFTGNVVYGVPRELTLSATTKF